MADKSGGSGNRAAAHPLNLGVGEILLDDLALLRIICQTHPAAGTCKTVCARPKRRRPPGQGRPVR